MMNQELTANLLRLGKQLAPDRFPQPSPETTEAWAMALDRIYPPKLWRDAIILYATQRVGERMCTPRDLLQAAADTVKRWESDPALNRELEEFRAQRMHTKYQQMLGDRYTPEAVPGPPPRGEIKSDSPDFAALKQRLARVRKALP